MYVDGAPEGLLCSDLTDEQKALFTDTKTWFDRGDSPFLYMNDAVMLADMALYYKNFTNSTHASTFGSRSYGVLAERCLRPFFTNGHFASDRPSSPPSYVMTKYPGWLADPVASDTGPRSLLDVYDAYIQSVPISGTADSFPFADNNSPLSFVFRTPFLVEPWRRCRGVGSPSRVELPSGFSSGPPSSEPIVYCDLTCTASGYWSSNDGYTYDPVVYSPYRLDASIAANPADTEIICGNRFNGDEPPGFSLSASFAFIDDIIHPITLPEEFGLTGDKVPSEWLGHAGGRVLDKTVLSAAFSILGSGAWFSYESGDSVNPLTSAHVGRCSCVGSSEGGMPSVSVGDFGESCSITNSFSFNHYEGDEKDYTTLKATIGSVKPAYDTTSCSFGGTASVSYSTYDDATDRRRCEVRASLAKVTSSPGDYENNVGYSRVEGDADHLYVKRAFLECPAGFSSRELYAPVTFNYDCSFVATVEQALRQTFEKSEPEEWEDRYRSVGTLARVEAAGESVYTVVRYVKFVPVGVIRSSGDAFPSLARRDDVILWRSADTASSLAESLLPEGLVANGLVDAAFTCEPGADVIDDVFPEDLPKAPAPESPGDGYEASGEARSFYTYDAKARFDCSISVGTTSFHTYNDSRNAAGTHVEYGFDGGVAAKLPAAILVTNFSFMPSKPSGGE